MFSDKIKTISLDTFITGFPSYAHTFRRILTHPLTFASNLNLSNGDEFWPSITYINYSIVCAFIFLIPVAVAHSEHPAKLGFLLRCLTAVGVCGIMLHYCLWIIGARHMSLKNTLSSYCYL